MTDYQRFLELFNTMGVVYVVWMDEDRDAMWISVTQAHFKFSLAYAFLGVEPDEHGSFEPREDPVSDGYGGSS